MRTWSLELPQRMPAKPLAEPPLPLLITGIAGVAGYNAFRYFYARFPGQVIGTRRKDNWPLDGPGVAACDIHDHDGLRRLFDRYQFRAVLNCEGTCKLKSCEMDPWLAWRVNVVGIQNLLEVLDAGTRLVHLSVDLVYSGERQGGYRESDPPDPVTIYGKTMAQSERWILADRPGACVLRISLPMGPSFNGHAGAIDWIESRFKKNKPATLFYDEFRTPTYTDCLNRVCHAVLRRPIAGLYHAGGPRRLSLYQIAQIINRVGGYSPDLLHGCLRHEAGPMPPRAGDVTMNSHRLRKVLDFEPFAPWPLNNDDLPDHREWHRRRVRAGSPRQIVERLCRVIRTDGIRA